MAIETLDALTLALNRAPKGALVVLDFWAEWAAPSKHMNTVVDELAKQHANVVFLKIEAENAPEIAERFEVEAVPTFVLLQRGKTVERISGANAAELTASVAKHAQRAPVPAPAPAPAPAKAAAETPGEPVTLTPELRTRLKALVGAAPCVAFIKGTPAQPRCGFSWQLIELFERNGVEWTHFNILEDDQVRQGLKLYSEWPTFPQVYVNGDLVGGLDIVKEMEANGELAGVFPRKPADLRARLKQLIGKAPVMLFMKGSPDAPQCGFSAKIVKILNDTGVPYETFDILEDEDVRQGLKTFSNWPTFPQLYVKGELMGGLDIVKEMQESGELMSALSA